MNLSAEAIRCEGIDEWEQAQRINDAIGDLDPRSVVGALGETLVVALASRVAEYEPEHRAEVQAMFRDAAASRYTTPVESETIERLTAWADATVDRLAS